MCVRACKCVCVYMCVHACVNMLTYLHTPTKSLKTFKQALYTRQRDLSALKSAPFILCRYQQSPETLQKQQSPDRVCVCVLRYYFTLDWGSWLHLGHRVHLRSHLLWYHPTVRTRSSRPPILRSHRRRCIKFVFSHCQHF